MMDALEPGGSKTLSLVHPMTSVCKRVLNWN